MAGAAQSRSPPAARPGALTHQQRWRRRAGPRGGGEGSGSGSGQPRPAGLAQRRGAGVAVLPSGGAVPAVPLGMGRGRTGDRGSHRDQQVTRDPSRRLPSPSCRAAESPRSADGAKSSERLDVGRNAAVLVRSAPGDI